MDLSDYEAMTAMVKQLTKDVTAIEQERSELAKFKAYWSPKLEAAQQLVNENSELRKKLADMTNDRDTWHERWQQVVDANFGFQAELQRVQGELAYTQGFLEAKKEQVELLRRWLIKYGVPEIEIDAALMGPHIQQ